MAITRNDLASFGIHFVGPIKATLFDWRVEHGAAFLLRSNMYFYFLLYTYETLAGHPGDFDDFVGQ